MWINRIIFVAIKTLLKSTNETRNLILYFCKKQSVGIAWKDYFVYSRKRMRDGMIPRIETTSLSFLIQKCFFDWVNTWKYLTYCIMYNIFHIFCAPNRSGHLNTCNATESSCPSLPFSANKVLLFIISNTVLCVFFLFWHTCLTIFTSYLLVFLSLF